MIIKTDLYQHTYSLLLLIHGGESKSHCYHSDLQGYKRSVIQMFIL